MKRFFRVLTSADLIRAYFRGKAEVRRTFLMLAYCPPVGHKVDELSVEETNAFRAYLKREHAAAVEAHRTLGKG